LHGGGRREVRLCQLCHTDQAFDPDTGNTIDLGPMVHKIHRGKELPSVEEGEVGTKYAIVGFRQSEHVYGEKVRVCDGGEHAAKPCESDEDCPGGTCSGEATAGVGFPQDIRNCQKCHADGATAANHINVPSTAACASCHDDVNPGETPTEAGPPGTGHEIAGAQAESDCVLCHDAEVEAEFDISVPGAHTLPGRSTQLRGLEAEILSATAAEVRDPMTNALDGYAVTITFHLSEGDGTPLTSLSGLGSLAAALSGPTTDLGGGSVPLLRPSIPRNLTSPDGTYTHTLSPNLPADATGTWRVGLEARRSVQLKTQDGTVKATFNEAAQNPVLDFSVDGSPVAPRREVVDIANCGSCHGTFSKDFSIHGNLRNQTDYCVICHNANETDFATRAGAVTGDGGNPVSATIHLKPMIHKIHTGEELEHKPYIIYGRNSSVNEFSDILYPGDRRDCATCHVDDSHLLPLPDGVLPTIETVVDTSTMPPVEMATGSIPPTQAACLSCHDGDAVRVHAETQTTASGDEACLVCHGEGKISAVSEVHAAAP
jgi:OmcA/MtrC family decaheme c-type cytochrome